MGELFGTDGIRGIAGAFPLDEETIYRCGQAVAARLQAKLNRSPRILTGRDTRHSGEWIEAVMTAGMRQASGLVISAGVMPTPGIAFLTRNGSFDAGVVISASHNLVPDNGIKIVSGAGTKLDDETESAIEQDISRLRIADCGLRIDERLLLPNPQSAFRNPQSEELATQYLSYLVGTVGENLDLTGMKVALDCANGAAYQIGPAVFAALGAQVDALFVEPDGMNINQNCGSLHVDQLSRYVKDHALDVGIALDGDADRALLVGPDGVLHDGDAILFVMANYLKESHRLKNDLVVGTIMSNAGLEKALRERGVQLHRTKVGDRYVLEKLLELGGSLGGEQSGHIIFPDISLGGDGLVTALQTLRVIKETGRSLAELTQGLVTYPQRLKNVPVKSKPPLESIPEIASQTRAIEQQLEGRGRLLLRYSGTENVARVMIEADDPVLVETLAAELAETIQKHLG
jgi:phosphoglucosamine mutase